MLKNDGNSGADLYILVLENILHEKEKNTYSSD